MWQKLLCSNIATFQGQMRILATSYLPTGLRYKHKLWNSEGPAQTNFCHYKAHLIRMLYCCKEGNAIRCKTSVAIWLNDFKILVCFCSIWSNFFSQCNQLQISCNVSIVMYCNQCSSSAIYWFKYVLTAFINLSNCNLALTLGWVFEHQYASACPHHLWEVFQCSVIYILLHHLLVCSHISTIQKIDL